MRFCINVGSGEKHSKEAEDRLDADMDDKEDEEEESCAAECQHKTEPEMHDKSLALSNPMQIVPEAEMKKPMDLGEQRVTVATARNEIPMEVCDSAAERGREEQTVEKLRKVLSDARADGNFLPAIHMVGKVFSEPASLQELFFVDEGGSIDFSSVVAMYEDIVSQQKLVAPLEFALWNLASTCATKPSIGSLKECTPLLVGLLAPEYHFATEQYEKIIGLLLKGLINRCSKERRTALAAYFERLSKEDFDRLLQVVQSYLTIRTLTVPHWQDADFANLRHAVEFLDLLYTANTKTNFHPWIDFYQDGINELLATHDELLQYDHGQWFVNRVAKGEVEGVRTERDPIPERVSYCEFPYLLDAASKARLLELEVHELQLIRRRINENRIILLQIRRDNIVDDALNQVQSIPRDQLTSALHVKFVGEFLGSCIMGYRSIEGAYNTL